MAAPWYTVALLALTALGATVLAAATVKHENSSCGRVWVTIHSPEIRLSARETLLDAVELNWNFNGCSSVPKQIGLFNDKPTSWSNALETFSIDDVEGFVITSKPLGPDTLPGGWDMRPLQAASKGPQCLWPWVGAGDEDIQTLNCLKIQPTWMEDHTEIHHLHIGDLAIPGTHNAGAWRFNTEISTLARDAFVLCQDRSIWAQLVHGIRYFDFRIAYYDFYPNMDDRYWLNHNLIRVRPLVPLLREIKSFLDHTKEVVFLDAHHFPVGFYDADGTPIRVVHAGLLDLVQRELDPHIAFYRDFSQGAERSGPSLQKLMTSNKRLLFSYVDVSVGNDNDWVWPMLPHLWANTNSPTELFQYLDRAIAAQPQPHIRSPLHSAMAQTTPTVLDILFLRGSIRTNADAVNRNVTARLATRWRHQANIISTDFFLGNDVVEVCILINEEKRQS